MEMQSWSQKDGLLITGDGEDKAEAARGELCSDELMEPRVWLTGLRK